jgi:hypothetical protein
MAEANGMKASHVAGTPLRGKGENERDGRDGRQTEDGKGKPEDLEGEGKH